MTQQDLAAYIGKHDWNSQRARTVFPIVWHVFTSYTKSGHLHGVDLGPFFSYYEHGYFYQYIADAKLSAITKHVFEKFQKDRASLDQYITAHVALTSQIEGVTKEYGDLQQKSDAEVLALFEKHLTVSWQWWHYATILEDKGHVIEAEIVPRFAAAHGLTLTEAQEKLHVLSTPEELSLLSFERKLFLELCLYVFDHDLVTAVQGAKSETLLVDAGFVKLCQEYQKTYFWIESDFYIYVVLDAERLVQKIRKEIDGKTRDHIAALHMALLDAAKSVAAEKQRLESELLLTDEDKHNIYFATRVLEWMDERKRGMMTDFYYLSQLFEEIGRRVGMSYHEIGLYTPPEIIELLTGKRQRDRELEEKRNTGVMLVFQQGKEPVLYYTEEGIALFRLFTDLSHATETLKGMVASRGGQTTVEGIVTVVHDPKTETFTDGAILVTSMTRVEFLPLMKRAKAIITDEGGIACHAAVVSREFGIPCVIGAKHATKKLKTGSQVTIDLTQGLIKII